MGLLPLLQKNPFVFFIVTVLLLFSVIAHELAHGWVALLCGDDTARARGRLSWNPLRHIDAMGAIMLIVAGFGWAKPVPVDYERLKYGRLAVFFVALAGCAVNLLIATGAIGLLVMTPLAMLELPRLILQVLIQINILLAAFNLIPIPPLDGSKVLMSFLPVRLQLAVAGLERLGFVLLLFLLFSGALKPVIHGVEKFMYKVFVYLFS